MNLHLQKIKNRRQSKNFAFPLFFRIHKVKNIRQGDVVGRDLKLYIPWWLRLGKESACKAEDPDSIPGLERSTGEGNSNPLQYSCLENFMARGAWQATVHGVVKSWLVTTEWLTRAHT